MAGGRAPGGPRIHRLQGQEPCATLLLVRLRGSRTRAETAAATHRAAIDGNWAFGAFQPAACNSCDDVFAETADVVFGDAWLPQYTDDWRGTNVVVTRSPEADRILADGVRDGTSSSSP